MGVSTKSLYSFFDEKIVDVLVRRFPELYDWQYNVLLKSLDGSNLVIVAPTGAGKSLPAEVIAVDTVLKYGKKVVYVAPLRSLAREKFEDFKKWYSIGVKSGLAMGEYWVESGGLADKDIVVTTYAKMVSLINHKTSFLRDVSLVIIDEFHVMSPEVEIIVAFAKKMGWRIVALSATVGNLEELAEWMDAKIFRSADRPIKLQGGVITNGSVYWVTGGQSRYGNNWIDVVKKYVDDGLSVIVFVNSRRKAERVAEQVASVFNAVDVDIPKDVMRFYNLISRGVAFHHAGLKNKERNIVEDLFRSGKIKVIVATKTLAMGVNLPADVVILKEIVKTEKNGDSFKAEWLDVMDVWQMLGRAGRRGKSRVGIGLIYTSKRRNVKMIIERYFEGKIEDAESRIANVIDNAIITYLAFFGSSRIGDILDFIGNTYGGYLNDGLLLVGYEAVHRLVANGMIHKQGEFYSLTKLGKLVANLFISVSSAKKMMNFDSGNILDVLWFLTGLKEFELPRYTKKDYNRVVFLADIFGGVRNDNVFWSRLKALGILLDWIGGKEVEEIVDRFGIGFGDVRVILETAEWLTYSLYKIKDFFVDGDVDFYHDIVWMIKYGVGRELVPFVKLKGVGRKRALQLFRNTKFKNGFVENNKLNKSSLSYWLGG